MSIKPPPAKKGNAKLAALSAMTEAPAKALTERAPGDLVPLNLKVPAAMKRRLKLFALENDTTMVDVVDKALTAYMESHK